MAFQNMEELAAAQQTCNQCNLANERTQVVVRRGSNNPTILFIGEAPGADEDKEGKPFVGRSGKLLDKWISRLGLTTEDYAISNICCCRPPENRRPTREEINTCFPWLEEKLNMMRPDIIVALGKTALQGLGFKHNSLLKHVGQKYDTKYAKRLYILPHPSYVLRSGYYIDTALDNLRELIDEEGGV